MRPLLISLFVVFSFLALSANVILAQDTTAVSIDQFETYKKEIDYSDTRNELRLKPRKKKKNQKEEEKEKVDKDRDNDFSFGGLGGILQPLAYLAILILAFSIIYLIFSNVKIDKKLSEQYITAEVPPEEEHIEDIDVQTEYDKALAAGNYRLALRMRFIEILQELSLSKRINWRYEKTNRDYARELVGSDIHHSFRNISNIFEWVWYGNQEINREEFDFYSLSFDQFKKQDQ